jgi:predicted alpha/beta-hydrolase family hydrolase
LTDGIVLTHGASGNAQMPLLVALAAALEARGLVAQRYDLPFRQAKPTGPPSPRGAARDREGLRQAVREMRDRVDGRVLLGGQSYGGRQASLLAAEEPGLVDALLLLAYPLHPPGQRDRPRVQHFPDLRTPAFFAHGSADPFGTLDEVEAARARIPARTALLAVEGAGHDLLRGRAPDVPGTIAAAFLAFLATLAAPAP